MTKKSKISFEFDLTSPPDFTEDLIPVDQNFYTRRVREISGVKRFGIPTAIKKELNLKPKDDVYFVTYDREHYFIVFNEVPDTSPNNYKRRKIIYAGHNQSLYVAVPPMLTKDYVRPLTGVSLTQPKGVPKNTWQIQLLFTEFTSKNKFENT
jgi:bifunctional DNA-binding transcriptional regulator/antitoxin component of YhaV-PrlF toxin-antitoxin module